jgi:hypothetical protein
MWFFHRYLRMRTSQIYRFKPWSRQWDANSLPDTPAAIARVEALAAVEWNRRRNFDYSIQAVTPTPTQSPLMIFFTPLSQMIEIPQDIAPADWKCPF